METWIDIWLYSIFFGLYVSGKAGVDDAIMKLADLRLEALWYVLKRHPLAKGNKLQFTSDKWACASDMMSVILTVSPLFVPPGPDHSQHTWLWGVVPAWHHFGHLHWPGITDVSNTHYRPFQPWKVKCWKSQLFIHSFHWEIFEDVAGKSKEYEPVTFNVLWITYL